MGDPPYTGFKIYRGLSPNVLWPIGTVMVGPPSRGDPGHEYNDTSVEEDTTYYYEVTTLNAPGEGAGSNNAVKPASEYSSWPQYGYDAANTGLCPIDTSMVTGYLRWETNLGDPITSSPVIGPDGTVWVAGDYHPKSQAGRWDPSAKTWIQDDVTSPCIDGGDGTMPVGDEPPPNGAVLNLGAYGGTGQASKSLRIEGTF